jgi:hypothetical protein
VPRRHAQPAISFQHQAERLCPERSLLLEPVQSFLDHYHSSSSLWTHVLQVGPSSEGMAVAPYHHWRV